MFRVHQFRKNINEQGTADENTPTVADKNTVVIPLGEMILTPTADQLQINQLQMEAKRATNLVEFFKNKVKELQHDADKQKEIEEKGYNIPYDSLMAMTKEIDSDDGLSYVLHNMLLREVDEDPEKANQLMQRHWNVTTGVKAPSNQLFSGRCWMFAGLNILVRQLINVHKLEPTFELSQSYLFFWHYYEQYNDILNLFFFKPELHDPYNIERNDILQEPLHDGANWINFYRLVKKYGVVPKPMYPETIPTAHSSEMKEILASMLANDLHTMEKKNLKINTDTNHDSAENKGQMEAFVNFRDSKVKEVVKLLCKFMGKPPLNGQVKLKTVANNLAISDPNHHKTSKIDVQSPAKFFSAINNMGGQVVVENQPLEIQSIDVDNLVQIINDPRDDKRKYDNGELILSQDGKWYTTEYQEHQIHRNLLYNLKDMEIISKIVLLSLKMYRPVWFACNMNTDVDKRRQGMDNKLFRTDLFTKFQFKMDKATRMKYGRAHCNHAMLIVGAETDEKDNVIAFNVENSWGKQGPNGGFYKMTIDWFKERAYTWVVHRNIIEQVLGKGIGEAPKNIGIYPHIDFFG
jgi:bleomycin hydrolase